MVGTHCEFVRETRRGSCRFFLTCYAFSDLSGNPSTCSLINSSYICNCAPGFDSNTRPVGNALLTLIYLAYSNVFATISMTNIQRSFCDAPCHPAASLPKDLNVYGDYMCEDADASERYIGDVCSAKCAFQGPGLTPVHLLSCHRNQTWVTIEGPCYAFPILKVSSENRYFASVSMERMTWPEAAQKMHLFSYNGLPGQLAEAMSPADNEDVRILAAGRDIWLGAAQDETGFYNGINWLLGNQSRRAIYKFPNSSGRLYSLESLFLENYTNFAPQEPSSNLLGGLIMLTNGTWCVPVFYFILF